MKPTSKPHLHTTLNKAHTNHHSLKQTTMRPYPPTKQPHIPTKRPHIPTKRPHLPTKKQHMATKRQHKPTPKISHGVSKRPHLPTKHPNLRHKGTTPRHIQQHILQHINHLNIIRNRLIEKLL